MNHSHARIRKALATMITVEKIGGGAILRAPEIPIMAPISYEVRLHTAGSTLTLASYAEIDLNRSSGAQSAARSAREFFVNEISGRLCSRLDSK